MDRKRNSAHARHHHADYSQFKDAWANRTEQARHASQSAKTAVKTLDKQINGLLDRIIDATQPSVITAYEKRIAKLEEDNLTLEEQAAKPAPSHTAFE
ncbi:MAG: hypothetical protein AAF092_15865 [Pseudomonadota bacterium]